MPIIPFFRYFSSTPSHFAFIALTVDSIVREVTGNCSISAFHRRRHRMVDGTEAQSLSAYEAGVATVVTYFEVFIY